jgi:YydG family peptide modification radical SAM enzyme
MVVILGNKCTAKCEMCCLNASPQCNEKIDYKQISEYILSSKEMPEIKIIHFSGGEAFLYYKDLLSLIRLCTDIEKSTSVITNGFWATNYEITLQRLKQLKEAGLYAIGVSYDEFHAKFISINNIKNILRASKELDLRTSVQAVIINGSENGDWIDMLGEDIADVIVNFITCDNVGEATINLNDSQFIRNIRSDGCVCRKGGTFSVLYDGSVWPCCSPSVYETELVVGNIHNNSKTVKATYDRLRSNLILKVLRNRGFDYFKELSNKYLDLEVPDKVISSCELCKLFFSRENIEKITPVLIKQLNDEKTNKKIEVF